MINITASMDKGTMQVIYFIHSSKGGVHGHNETLLGHAQLMSRYNIPGDKYIHIRILFY